MKVAILLLALIAFASALNFRSEWDNFKSKYGRVYASTQEEGNRFSIFKQNLRKAQRMNARDPHARFGVTKFSDLTVDEFKSIFLMNVSRPAVDAPIARAPKNVQLPTSFDWSSKGALTPVKDQGQCGSCWDFSATETIESVCFLAGYPLTQLSEQQILDCDSSDYGCNGGWPYNAYQYVIGAGGLETEADYPYTAQDGSCEFNSQDIECPITSWKYVTQSQDENAMQSFLYSNSPMSVCVDAEIWQTYTGGVITPSSNCGNSIDHCVQITGWQQMQGLNVWNVRNSWGADWGENGYIYVQIGSDVCSIAEVVTVPCVVSKANGQTVC
jgi:C1A family cysteine protease